MSENNMNKKHLTNKMRIKGHDNNSEGWITPDLDLPYSLLSPLDQVWTVFGLIKSGSLLISLALNVD